MEGIKKNEKINETDLPLLVPEFDYDGLNDNPFKVNKDDFKKLEKFVANVEDEVLILKENIKVRTLNKLRSKNNFILEGKKKDYRPEVLLKYIDNFFNNPVKRLKEVKILEDHIIHYQEIRTDLLEHSEKLEKEILQVLNSPNLTVEEIDRLFDEEKISKDEYKRLIKQLSFSDFKVLNQCVDYEIFKEHYYVPILLREDSRHFQHIIKVPSEIEFLRKFKEYLENPMNKLKEYDWWYFSKIDESLDRIKIPYFDTQKGDYSNFCPDFIFWLKKDNQYYIKFIDPKGIEHTRNPIDKILGFEEFEKEITKLNKDRGIKVALYYFNDQMPPYVEQKYKKYWTNNFDEIFLLIPPHILCKPQTMIQ